MSSSRPHRSARSTPSVIIALVLALVGVEVANAHAAPAEIEGDQSTACSDTGANGNSLPEGVEPRDDEADAEMPEDHASEDGSEHDSGDESEDPEIGSDPAENIEETADAEVPESEATQPPQQTLQAVSMVEIDQLYVLSGDTNLRESANASSTLILTIPADATVRTVETNGTWTRVRYLTFEGWALTSKLGERTATQTVPSAPGRQSTANLRLRSGPSTSNSILTTMPKGSIAQVLGWKTGWRLVRYSNTTGWAMTSFLATVGNTLSWIHRWVGVGGRCVKVRIPFWSGRIQVVTACFPLFRKGTS